MLLFANLMCMHEPSKQKKERGIQRRGLKARKQCIELDSRVKKNLTGMDCPFKFNYVHPVTVASSDAIECAARDLIPPSCIKTFTSACSKNVPKFHFFLLNIQCTYFFCSGKWHVRWTNDNNKTKQTLPHMHFSVVLGILVKYLDLEVSVTIPIEFLLR